MFAARGFRSSALREVADRVGVTPANLLYHFGSKEGLLLAVIEERDVRSLDDVRKLPERGGLDAIRGIVQFAEQSERERGLTALHTVLQAESLEPDAPAHDYFLARSRVLRRWTTTTLRAAQRAGDVRADVDCEAKGAELVAFLEGAAMVWLVDPDTSLVALYRNFIESFIFAVSARGGSP